MMYSLLATVLLLGLLAACSAYHREYPAQDVVKEGIERYIVQVDDFGTFWSVAGAQRVLDRIEALSKQENIHVSLFIHGWHHNASESDDNLQRFTAKLEEIHDRLNQQAFRNLRARSSNQEAIRVIGIYAGWRGRALPGVLDYFNLWWRKAAAERVGDGDIREFVLRLQRIYLRANAVRRVEGSAIGSTPRMGLVSVGHSLGGQVLLRAIAAGMEHDLTLRARHQSDGIGGGPVVPPASVRIDIDSFGDLNILVNPAIEAYQFARIDALSRQLTCPSNQSPQLVVFSADNDVPRQAFFPIARALTRAFRSGFRSGTAQGQLWGTALGEYVGQQSHDLHRVATSQADTLTEQDYGSAEGVRRIREWNFTSPTTFAHVALVPRENADVRPFSPTAVVYTHDRLIDGHSGIFGAQFWAFLLDYVSFMEGKRLLWRLEPAASSPGLA